MALWAQLRPRLEARVAASEAVQDLAGAPEDPDTQAALRNQLRKILSAGQALSERLAAILEAQAPSVSYGASAQTGSVAQGKGVVAAGASGVAAGGDVHGDLHIHGAPSADDLAPIDESLRAGGHLVMAESGAAVVIGEASVPMTAVDAASALGRYLQPAEAPQGRSAGGRSCRQGIADLRCHCCRAVCSPRRRMLCSGDTGR